MSNSCKTITEDMEFVTKHSIPWHELKNTTILITGASGFLAAYMIETILFLNQTKQLGITILALVRNKSAFYKKYTHYSARDELVCIEGDVCDELYIDLDIDYIVHSASQASPKYYSKDPVGTLSANTLGTANLLELARIKNVKSFLYFSSAEVYGAAMNVPTAESDYGFLDPLDVRSCYAESKRMGENMCVSWHHQFDIQAKIVRPFHTYGPGMQLDDSRVYADFVADVVNSRDIVLRSDGLARRSFCYLADATAGFWMVLLKGESAVAYNIGDPKGEISIYDLAHLVAGVYPEKEISVNMENRIASDSYLPSQIPVTCPDITLVKGLGWCPVTSLEEGFRKTIKSYL